MQHTITITIDGEYDGTFNWIEIESKSDAVTNDQEAQELYKGDFRQVVGMWSEYVQAGGTDPELIYAVLEAVEQDTMMQLFGFTDEQRKQWLHDYVDRDGEDVLD